MVGARVSRRHGIGGVLVGRIVGRAVATLALSAALVAGWSRPARALAQQPTVAAPAGATGSRASTAPVGQQAASPADETWRWTIRPGDTLIGIGRAYLREPRDWPVLARVNRITDPTRLRVGSTLLVPLRMLRFFVGTAEVVWVRGAVTAITAAGESRVIAAGAQVETGSRIETGPDSAVRVRLVDGALLLVGERSRVSVDELTVFALPGVVRTKLGVGQGQVEAQVNRQEPGSRYEIRTPVLTTAVRGTDFRVGTLDEGRRARTEVTSGVVDAAVGTSSVAVEAGLGVVAAADAPLSAPRPLPLAPDLSALPSRLERLPVQLAWPPVSAARGYRVQLFATVGERPLVAERVVDSPTTRWPDLADDRYTVRIRAIDDAGLEGRDAEATIEVKARPQPPFASEPVDGGRVYGARPALRWTRADGVASYDLQIASDEGFDRLVVDTTALAEVSAAPVLEPGRYFWRVASRLASGDRGPFGDAQSFTLRRVPDSRRSEGAVDLKTLTLRWSAGASGETAQFQLAADAGFTRVLVDRTLTGREIALPRPAPGTYYLRVRALDADGVAGPFGSTQQIDVPKLPRRRWWLWLIPPAVVGGIVALL